MPGRKPACRAARQTLATMRDEPSHLTVTSGLSRGGAFLWCLRTRSVGQVGR
jgi:hypothetical protein